jgi:uncharacterized membrane protein YbhN (UPF0104 family)
MNEGLAAAAPKPGPSGQADARLARFTRAVALFVGAGALLYGGALVVIGAEQTAQAMARLGWSTWLAGTLVANLGLLLRFARWSVLMKALGHALPAWRSGRIYVGGLALSATPGKLGETLRSALLLPHGVPVPASLAAFFADRLADVIGVALLGALAALAAGQRQPLLEWLALGAIGLAIVLKGIARGPAARFSPKPGCWRRLWHALRAPLLRWAGVWTLTRAPLFFACGFGAFALQGLVFAAYVQTVATPLPEALTVARCLAIFAAATLIGAASGVPSGLGVMEAALVWQLQAAGVDAAAALAAALLLRASALWCTLGLAAASLLSLTQRESSQPGQRST